MIIIFQENLAFGKPTVQTSTDHGGVSSRAVDGNSATNYLKGKSCTHTFGNVYKPWWRVDLGQIEPVSEVYIVNQEDEPWWLRQTNFEIRVGRLAFLSILLCFVLVIKVQLHANPTFSLFCY